MIIAQLYDTDNNPIDPNILAKMFDCSVLTVNSIFASIPKEWKKIIKQNKTKASEMDAWRYNCENWCSKAKIVSAAYYIINKNKEASRLYAELTSVSGN